MILSTDCTFPLLPGLVSYFLEDFGCLSTCWEVALLWRCEGCPRLVTPVCDLCLTPVFLCVRCLITDHGMIPLFFSIHGRHSLRPAVRRVPVARSRLSAVPDLHRTGHYFAAAVNTRAESALLRALSATKKGTQRTR